MGSKSMPIAYFLWFFLGWLGAHQFYLRRDRHAFFTWATLGGVCGIGWLRDLFYIPTYVADANESPEYMEILGEEMRKREPSQSFCRWAAAVAMGYIFGLLAYTVLWSEDLHPRYINAIGVISHMLTGLGVYMISNEGRQKVALKWCLLGSYIVLPFTMIYAEDNLLYASMVPAGLASYKTEWRRQPRSSGLCRRFFTLSIIGLLYFGAVSTSIYYNATVTTKDGETVPLREAVQHFFNSPAWKESKETMKQIYEYYKHHGWKAIWKELVSAFDPQGEAHAYQVLNLSRDASIKEIKSVYKALALKYHPDKQKDPAKKKEMADMFMEIQHAYDTLSKLKKKRTNSSEH